MIVATCARNSTNKKKIGKKDVIFDSMLSQDAEANKPVLTVISSVI